MPLKQNRHVTKCELVVTILCCHIVTSPCTFSSLTDAKSPEGVEAPVGPGKLHEAGWSNGTMLCCSFGVSQQHGFLPWLG